MIDNILSGNYTDICFDRFHVLIQNFINRAQEGNVLFNDALNTFYLQLIGIGHLVTNHLDKERGNLLLLFSD